MAEWIFCSENIFKSERNSVNLIEPILNSLKDALSMKDENFYNIMIAVTEGVNNAINHGNKLNPDKIVEFSVKADENKLHVRISDQGTGFDPNTIADCLEPENLLKSSGRGVFIIRELMDDVRIESSGNGTVINMSYFYNNH
jgi:serine/threonine-protein kinase RsbW